MQLISAHHRSPKRAQLNQETRSPLPLVARVRTVSPSHSIGGGGGGGAEASGGCWAWQDCVRRALVPFFAGSALQRKRRGGAMAVYSRPSVAAVEMRRPALVSA